MLDSGAKLTVVECTYGERDAELGQNKHVNYVRVRAAGVHKTWTKECLLNLGIARAPDAKYIATLDADIQFRSPTWAADAVDALQHYPVIQPWSYCYDLGPNGEHIATHRSFASLVYAGKPVMQGPNAKPGGYEFGHPGFAWCYTRQALEHVGGLVETAALGAADHHMAMALIGKVGDSIPGNLGDGYKAPLYQWQARAQHHIQGHIGALNGTIEHFWHGAKEKRAYVSRWEILSRHSFNPTSDLKRNTHGVLELAGNKPKLSRDIDHYFRSRDEDFELTGLSDGVRGQGLCRAEGGSRGQPRRSAGRQIDLRRRSRDRQTQDPGPGPRDHREQGRV